MNETLSHRSTSGSDAEVATPEALSALYHGGYHRFIRVAEAITGSAEDAQDAVQEGFANALRNLESFESRGSLEGWAWQCVVNAARMSRRRSARAAPSSDLPETADRSANGAEQAGRLLPQLVRLPERQRLVLFLRYFADLPYEAIADALQISPGTVAATLNAAHRNLRLWLKEVEE